MHVSSTSGDHRRVKSHRTAYPVQCTHAIHTREVPEKAIAQTSIRFVPASILAILAIVVVGSVQFRVVPIREVCRDKKKVQFRMS